MHWIVLLVIRSNYNKLPYFIVNVVLLFKSKSDTLHLLILAWTIVKDMALERFYEIHRSSTVKPLI